MQIPRLGGVLCSNSVNFLLPYMRALMQTLVVCQDPRSYHRIIFYIHVKHRALWQVLIEKHTTHMWDNYRPRERHSDAFVNHRGKAIESGPKLWRGSGSIRITCLTCQNAPKSTSCIKHLKPFRHFWMLKDCKNATMNHVHNSFHSGCVVCKHVNIIQFKWSCSELELGSQCSMILCGVICVTLIEGVQQCIRFRDRDSHEYEQCPRLGLPAQFHSISRLFIHTRDLNTRWVACGSYNELPKTQPSHSYETHPFWAMHAAEVKSKSFLRLASLQIEGGQLSLEASYPSYSRPHFAEGGINTIWKEWKKQYVHRHYTSDTWNPVAVFSFKLPSCLVPFLSKYSIIW